MRTDKRKIAFHRIGRAALAQAEPICRQWLPDGYRRGAEFVARNPKRDDRHAGSFSINLTSGRWADFATGDAGGDFISLAAYLFDLSQSEAAERLAAMLGVSAYV